MDALYVWGIGGGAFLIAIPIFVYVSERSTSERVRRAGRRIKLMIAAALSIVFVFGMGFPLFQFLWPGRWVEATDPQWHVERNGTVILDSVTIVNDLSFDLKDFVIGCDANGKSGTTIRTLKTTVYETLTKGQSKQFVSLRLGAYPDQATSLQCRVLDASHVFN